MTTQLTAEQELVALCQVAGWKLIWRNKGTWLSLRTRHDLVLTDDSGIEEHHHKKPSCYFIFQSPERALNALRAWKP